MSYLRGSLLAGAGLSLVMILSAAHPARAENLGQAIESALNHHPSVQAAFANREAYAAEEGEKFSNYFPKISASAQVGRMYGDNSTSRGLSVTRGAGYSWLGEGSVTLSQMLFDGFETRRRVAAATARTGAAEEDISAVREELALKTTLAYLDVLRTRQAAAALKEHQEKLTTYYSRIRDMVAEGAADKSMESQARDLQIQLETTRADLESQHRIAIAQYLEMTGNAPAEPMPRPALDAHLIPVSLPSAVAQATEHNFGLKSKQLQGEGLGHDANAEKAILYPDLNADLSYLKSDKDDLLGGEMIDARAVMKLNWNFSTGGAELARIRKAKHRAAESRAQAEDMRRQLEREITVAWSELDKAATQHELQQEREKVSRELYVNYESQFEGARINLLQLLQADNAHFNAELAAMNSDFRLLGARFNVLASMGRLQEALNVVPAAASIHVR